MIVEQGTLILSPPKADHVSHSHHSSILDTILSKSHQYSKVPIKRFPLAEFHAPYIPDQDRQELPNSVILDFKDGSTLQCACENPGGQAHVLQGTFLFP